MSCIKGFRCGASPGTQCQVNKCRSTCGSLNSTKAICIGDLGPDANMTCGCAEGYGIDHCANGEKATWTHDAIDLC